MSRYDDAAYPSGADRVPTPGSQVTETTTDQDREYVTAAPIPATGYGPPHQETRDVTEAVREASTDVAQTVKEDIRTVAEEVGDQARHVTTDAKDRIRQQAETQQQQWAERLSTISGDLRKMAADQPETPARALVGQMAERGSAFADYLGQRSPQQVLDEIQDFARRRPGTFVLAAAAAGFVAGRVGKGVWQAQKEGGSP
jgi:ElaB/YqjD/DUF883 family membrane-anchored ribosome-binding protein